MIISTYSKEKKEEALTREELIELVKNNPAVAEELLKQLREIRERWSK